MFCVPPADDSMPSTWRVARGLGSDCIALCTYKVVPSARLPASAITRHCGHEDTGPTQRSRMYRSCNSSSDLMRSVSSRPSSKSETT